MAASSNTWTHARLEKIKLWVEIHLRQTEEFTVLLLLTLNIRFSSLFYVYFEYICRCWSTFIHALFQQIVSKHLPCAWYWVRGIQQCTRQMKLLSSCNVYLNEGLCWTNKLKNRWIYQKKNKQYPGHSEWFYSPESVIHKNHHIICYVCVCVCVKVAQSLWPHGL